MDWWAQALPWAGVEVPADRAAAFRDALLKVLTAAAEKDDFELAIKCDAEKGPSDLLHEALVVVRLVRASYRVKTTLKSRTKRGELWVQKGDLPATNLIRHESIGTP